MDQDFELWEEGAEYYVSCSCGDGVTFYKWEQDGTPKKCDGCNRVYRCQMTVTYEESE